MRTTRLSYRPTNLWDDDDVLLASIYTGLLPSSVAGWAPAVRALRSTGGIIHVHENVLAADLDGWKEDTRMQFESYLHLFDKSHLEVIIEHLETVKSYAPRVYHVVLDLRFRQK